MAYIEFANIDESSFDVRVNGLDTGYNQALRTVTFYCYDYNTDREMGRTSMQIANGISRTSWVWFNGLNPNTKYLVEVRISNITGSSDVWLDKTVWTDEEVSGPYLVPPTFSIYDYGEDTIILNVSPVSGATAYGVYLDGNWKKDVSSGLQVIDGLTPGKRYQVQMDSYNSNTDEESGLSSSEYVTLLYPYPNVTILEGDIGATEVVITWNSVINATKYDVYLNGQLKGSVAGRAFWFENLLPNTEYTCYVLAYNGTTYSNSGMLPITVFKTLAGRPNDWEWEYNIYSGGPFYTQSNNIVYLMRASHWNNFTTKINDFRRYKGFSNYSFTTATTSTTETGIRNCINQAINAINQVALTYQNNIYSGDDIAASIFTEMRDNLNSIT